MKTYSILFKFVAVSYETSNKVSAARCPALQRCAGAQYTHSYLICLVFTDVGETDFNFHMRMML